MTEKVQPSGAPNPFAKVEQELKKPADQVSIGKASHLFNEIVKNSPPTVISSENYVELKARIQKLAEKPETVGKKSSWTSWWTYGKKDVTAFSDNVELFEKYGRFAPVMEEAQKDKKDLSIIRLSYLFNKIFELSKKDFSPEEAAGILDIYKKIQTINKSNLETPYDGTHWLSNLIFYGQRSNATPRLVKEMISRINELKENPEFWKQAVLKNPFALVDAPENVQKDSNVLLQALSSEAMKGEWKIEQENVGSFVELFESVLVETVVSKKRGGHAAKVSEVDQQCNEKIAENRTLAAHILAFYPDKFKDEELVFDTLKDLGLFLDLPFYQEVLKIQIDHGIQATRVIHLLWESYGESAVSDPEKYMKISREILIPVFTQKIMSLSNSEKALAEFDFGFLSKLSEAVSLVIKNHEDFFEEFAVNAIQAQINAKKPEQEIEMFLEHVSAKVENSRFPKFSIRMVAEFGPQMLDIYDLKKHEKRLLLFRAIKDNPQLSKEKLGLLVKYVENTFQETEKVDFFYEVLRDVKDLSTNFIEVLKESGCLREKLSEKLITRLQIKAEENQNNLSEGEQKEFISALEGVGFNAEKKTVDLLQVRDFCSKFVEKIGNENFFMILGSFSEGNKKNSSLLELKKELLFSSVSKTDLKVVVKNKKSFFKTERVEDSNVTVRNKQFFFAAGLDQDPKILEECKRYGPSAWDFLKSMDSAKKVKNSTQTAQSFKVPTTNRFSSLVGYECELIKQGKLKESLDFILSEIELSDVEIDLEKAKKFLENLKGRSFIDGHLLIDFLNVVIKDSKKVKDAYNQASGQIVFADESSKLKTSLLNPEEAEKSSESSQEQQAQTSTKSNLIDQVNIWRGSKSAPASPSEAAYKKLEKVIAKKHGQDLSVNDFIRSVLTHTDPIQKDFYAAQERGESIISLKTALVTVLKGFNFQKSDFLKFLKRLIEEKDSENFSKYLSDELLKDREFMKWVVINGGLQEFASLNKDFQEDPDFVRDVARFAIYESEETEKAFLELIEDKELRAECENLRKGAPIFNTLVEVFEKGESLKPSFNEGKGELTLALGGLGVCMFPVAKQDVPSAKLLMGALGTEPVTIEHPGMDTEESRKTSTPVTSEELLTKRYALKKEADFFVTKIPITRDLLLTDDVSGNLKSLVESLVSSDLSIEANFPLECELQLKQDGKFTINFSKTPFKINGLLKLLEFTSLTLDRNGRLEAFSLRLVKEEGLGVIGTKRKAMKKMIAFKFTVTNDDEGDKTTWVCTRKLRNPKAQVPAPGLKEEVFSQLRSLLMGSQGAQNPPEAIGDDYVSL